MSPFVVCFSFYSNVTLLQQFVSLPSGDAARQLRQKSCVQNAANVALCKVGGGQLETLCRDTLSHCKPLSASGIQKTVHVPIFFSLLFLVPMFSSFTRVQLVVLPSPVSFILFPFNLLFSCPVSFSSAFSFFLSLYYIPSLIQLFLSFILPLLNSLSQCRVPLPSPRPKILCLLAPPVPAIPCIGIVRCLPLFAHNSCFPVSANPTSGSFPVQFIPHSNFCPVLHRSHFIYMALSPFLGFDF